MCVERMVSMNTVYYEEVSWVVSTEVMVMSEHFVTLFTPGFKMRRGNRIKNYNFICIVFVGGKHPGEM